MSLIKIFKILYNNRLMNIFKPVFIGVGYISRRPPNNKASIYLRESFENSGPTYIKIGQFIANRKDIFGYEMSSTMEKLQDGVKPIPWNVLSKSIDTDVFEYIDETPLATASISQVHRATYKGKSVVLKIKKPNIHTDMMNDMSSLKSILNMIPVFSNKRQILYEFEIALNQELDFTREVCNIREFNEMYKFSDTIVTPTVFSEVCTENLIVMSFVPKTLQLTSSYSCTLINIFIEQLLYEGIVHGDLHAGNIGLDSDGKIILYDFGNVIRVSKKYRHYMREFVYYLQIKDNIQLINTMKLMGMKIKDEKTTVIFIDKFLNYIDTLDMKSFTFNPDEIQDKVPIILDRTTFTLLRSYSLLEGYCKRLDPNLSYDDILSRTIEMLYMDSDYIQHRASKDIMKLMSANSSRN